MEQCNNCKFKTRRAQGLFCTKQLCYCPPDESGCSFHIPFFWDEYEHGTSEGVSENVIKGVSENVINGNDMRYIELRRLYQKAYDQATKGKGEKRHGSPADWEDQVSMKITQDVGRGYPEGQALKKINESSRLDRDAAIAELYGAINYLFIDIYYIEHEED
jgi:hypothetical protein